MKFNLGLDKGNYRITFTLSSKRKLFFPGTTDELVARNVLRRMQFDWEQGQFDTSLQSYKLKERLQSATKVPLATIAVKSDTKLLPLWDQWVTSLNLPLRVLNDHYHCCRVMIAMADSDWSVTTWFLQSALSASTWNTRRRFIKSCVAWALNEGLIEGKNPWISLKSRRSAKTSANPFTKTEVKQIIKAFESNQFCHQHSPCKHSYYVPYLKFLLLTGVRPGEAIALQWKHINFENGLIEISEAMGRDLESSPYSTRKVRKETKTGTVRYLPMNAGLRALLCTHRCENATPDTLVFCGYRGRGTLDIRAFRETWKKVLNGLGMEYRKPYQCRHTALSHIAQNHGLLAAAKVAGHKSLDMVSRHYARFTGDLNNVMPEFF